jgi:hypothetical protein
MIERGRVWGGPQWRGGGWEGAGMDPVAVGEVVGEMPAWTQQWWRWCGIKAGSEEEQARGMNPAAVKEAWRWSRSGCAGGGELKPPGLGFKGQSYN